MMTPSFHENSQDQGVRSWDLGREAISETLESETGLKGVVLIGVALSELGTPLGRADVALRAMISHRSSPYYKPKDTYSLRV